tara:strand:- start:140 stop:859 length:720 start_codon:yes stop_codon:yes gene_type:complete
MALPKIDLPLYELELPSNGKALSYRPFLVKEEKILLMAMESENEKEMVDSVRQIINNCVSGEGFDVDKVPLFDIEYILLHLRGVSMGGVVTMKYKNKTCTQEKCEPLSVDIDILSSEIEKNPEHNPKIELTDTVGLVMGYPDINMISKLSGANESIEASMDVIAKCIEQVYDEESVYSRTDFTFQEIKEFVDNLTQPQFEKIQKFFNTTPKIFQDVNVSCDKCDFKETIKLEGLSSFFD